MAGHLAGEDLGGDMECDLLGADVADLGEFLLVDASDHALGLGPGRESVAVEVQRFGVFAIEGDRFLRDLDAVALDFRERDPEM